MPSAHRYRTASRVFPTVVLAALAVVLVVATLMQLGTQRSGAATESPRGEIRVDQVGYVPDEPKYAYLMAPSRSLGAARYEVRDEQGRTVLTGWVGASTGNWNSGYPDVRVIDLGSLRREGTYRVHVTGPVTATSPPFSIASRQKLLVPLTAGHVRFFQAERDGENVISSVLHRRPSHLNDRNATVYRTPRYSPDGETLLDAGLVADAELVDVSGGWFDAGDFLKFTQTTSYTVATMLLAERTAPRIPGLAAETDHGLEWLDRVTRAEWCRVPACRCGRRSVGNFPCDHRTRLSAPGSGRGGRLAVERGLCTRAGGGGAALHRAGDVRRR
ncbi:cellulase N-terminal Ig-like domain-containing protein [Streptomyces sp. NPDC017966]|uniref:glycoside hydrolase family 9 protein n=1 Tax=Streptomyces sp. NPDC017966 TaxID=3365023 RepID=UPI0037A9F6C5